MSHYSVIWGFPGGSAGKEPICQCRRRKRCRFDPFVGKIPWKRKWQLTPVFLPGKSHGQRSLVGYSPWGRRELDTTQWLNNNIVAIQGCIDFPGGASGKEPHCQEMQETWVGSLGGEDPLEEDTATHSSTLAWEIPWTEESGGLQSIGSQRARHNWAHMHGSSWPAWGATSL